MVQTLDHPLAGHLTEAPPSAAIASRYRRGPPTIRSPSLIAFDASARPRAPDRHIPSAAEPAAECAGGSRRATTAFPEAQPAVTRGPTLATALRLDQPLAPRLSPVQRRGVRSCPVCPPLDGTSHRAGLTRQPRHGGPGSSLLASASRRSDAAAAPITSLCLASTAWHHTDRRCNGGPWLRWRDFAEGFRTTCRRAWRKRRRPRFC